MASDSPSPCFSCSQQKHVNILIPWHTYHGLSPVLLYFAPGVATSRDGLRWERGSGDIAGARGAAKDADVGRVLAPNADWWWHDTRHMAVSDVQARPLAS